MLFEFPRTNILSLLTGSVFMLNRLLRKKCVIDTFGLELSVLSPKGCGVSGYFFLTAVIGMTSAHFLRAFTSFLTRKSKYVVDGKETLLSSIENDPRYSVFNPYWLGDRRQEFIWSSKSIKYAIAVLISLPIILCAALLERVPVQALIVLGIYGTSIILNVYMLSNEIQDRSAIKRVLLALMLSLIEGRQDIHYSTFTAERSKPNNMIEIKLENEVLYGFEIYNTKFASSGTYFPIAVLGDYEIIASGTLDYRNKIVEKITKSSFYTKGPIKFYSIGFPMWTFAVYDTLSALTGDVWTSVESMEQAFLLGGIVVGIASWINNNTSIYTRLRVAEEDDVISGFSIKIKCLQSNDRRSFSKIDGTVWGMVEPHNKFLSAV